MTGSGREKNKHRSWLMEPGKKKREMFTGAARAQARRDGQAGGGKEKTS